MTQFGVALIGAGMIAKTHVSALSALHSRCRLKVIVSTRPERAEYLLSIYQGTAPQLTNDLSIVLNDPDIHYVIVATPPNIRIDLIDSLTKAGKHILLEKPVARTVDESEQVVEICKLAKVKLAILFQHRMWDTTKVANELLSSGDLGNIGLVEIAAPLWRPQSYYNELGRGTYERDGGGVLITQAIHTIDLALSLTGPVSRVQAMAATSSLHKMESEDFAVAGLHFKSGAVGSFVASTATYPHGKESIVLHGEHGSLRLLSHDMKVFWRDGTCKDYKSTIEPDGSLESKSVFHKRMIEHFMDCIEHGGAPLVSGEDALDSHRFIAAIEHSSRTGCAVDV